MSLDVTLTAVRPTEVTSANITHNLVPMAKEAGIYQHLWRPDEIGITKAAELILPYPLGCCCWNKLSGSRHLIRQTVGAGEHFVPFVRHYLEACEANPTRKSPYGPLTQPAHCRNWL